jgi:hypothetical protein
MTTNKSRPTSNDYGFDSTSGIKKEWIDFRRLFKYIQKSYEKQKQ